MDSPSPSSSALGVSTIDGEELTYDKDLRLGGGRNGSVFQGSLNKNVVAVKVLSSEASSDTFFDRVHSWRSLNHANVCEVYRVSSNEEDSLYLVMQCHVNGNSRQYLARNPNVDRGKIILETALGMQYLHSCDIIHGGLKPTNILIKDSGEACVSDWAMVEVQPSRNKEAHRYFSPEAWKGIVSRPSDVFSFAMSAYELYTLSQPWGVLSEKQIYQLVATEDARPDRPDPTRDARVGLNNYFWDIIEECWHKEPRMRPSFDIVVRLWRSDGADTQVSVFSAMTVPAASRGRCLSLKMQPNGSDPVMASLTAEFGQLSTRSTSLGRSSTVASTRSFKSGPPAYEKPPTASPTSPLSPLPNYSPLSSQIFSATVSSSTDASSLSTPRSHPMDDLPPISPVSSTRSSLVILSPASRPKPRAEPFRVNSLSNSSDYSRHWDPTSSLTRSYTPQLSAFAEVDEHIAHSESPSLWEAKRRGMGAITQPIATAWDRRSALSAESEGFSGTGSSSSLSHPPNAILLVGALQAEVQTTRRRAFIDNCLSRIQYVATQCDKGAQKLVTAGAVPVLIHLLKIRAAEPDGLEVVLTTLGLVAHDTISANTIYRTNTTRTLIEIVKSSTSDPVITLALWCLSRICRNADVAAGLIKQNLVSVVLEKSLHGNVGSARMSAWCIGILIHNDAIADVLSELGVIPEIAAYLRQVSTTNTVASDDICAGLYAVARIARTIKLSKALYKQGCVSLVSFHLTSSNDPSVLMWAARAVGCMMRPNSADMAKVLLDADVARGLSRLPSVLPPEIVEPLGSFAFAIQRFSCAEWGGGTRKALVDAGVVDALLAALRTVADEPYPQIHMQMALAVSFLGDVGGSAIRKEVVSAGGITILKRVGENGSADVSKACSMAVTSITGNLWTRNAASAKTAMTHNWSGGCPDYHTACPVPLDTESLY
ncbi:uncharacterized protein ARMOST_12345 [Armillaria ostoyae]|uniref:Protein kinase domain-containing protein n=1 Tax=Armillaria ostoyae TaxID=47428 RepID=A0A284RJM4_ARMOS|nr:uncharacterized protein ARMOST_12345 [Armillaria ostoyae]